MTEKRRKYFKEYRKKHRKEHRKYLASWRENNRNKWNGYSKRDDIKYPWRITWRAIQIRVKDPENKFYFGKGIKNLLNMKDLKYLWFRDKADRMFQPRIHRKNSEKDYTIRNCEYIEEYKHAKMHHR